MSINDTETMKFTAVCNLGCDSFATTRNECGQFLCKNHNGPDNISDICFLRGANGLECNGIRCVWQDKLCCFHHTSWAIAAQFVFGTLMEDYFDFDPFNSHSSLRFFGVKRSNNSTRFKRLRNSSTP